jgi:hypothetical protein
MANSSKKQNWIKDAIKRPGAFGKKAKAADMSTAAYANKVMSNKEDFSKLDVKQASLAKTLMGFNKPKKKRSA